MSTKKAESAFSRTYYLVGKETWLLRSSRRTYWFNPEIVDSPRGFFSSAMRHDAGNPFVYFTSRGVKTVLTKEELLAKLAKFRRTDSPPVSRQNSLGSWIRKGVKTVRSPQVSEARPPLPPLVIPELAKPEFLPTGGVFSEAELETPERPVKLGKLDYPRPVEFDDEGWVG